MILICFAIMRLKNLMRNNTKPTRLSTESQVINPTKWNQIFYII